MSIIPRRFSKFFLLISFLCTLISTEIIKSETKDSFPENKVLSSRYSDSKKELGDYIIGSGDGIYIDFYPAKELSGFYSVNEEGEVYLPRLDGFNVSGLTTSEVEDLLEKSYSTFLISPEIKVKIAFFREIKVTLSGEVRYPGVYTFPAYRSGSFLNFFKYENIVKEKNLENSKKISSSPTKADSKVNTLEKTYFQQQNYLENQFAYKKDSKNTANISDVILKAGGITSFSDLTRIKIVRNVPLGKGGGKKVALVNLNEFLNEFDTINDLRLFDGDQIFIPRLTNKNKEQIPKSVVSGLSPRFVEVNVYGKVENPGTFKLPLEGTLSDAIDITGPRKPFSGKVILIRYNSDGSVSKEKISYFANAPRGSKRNPYIKEGDLITVTSSVLGKTTNIITEITAPLQGIYFTKELIEDF